MTQPIVIDNLIPTDLAKALRHDLLREAVWEDGAATAGAIAVGVKHNLQAKPDVEPVPTLRKLVANALCEHSLFEAFVKPSAIALMFSRYDAPGACYGPHVDGAYMIGSGIQHIRRDVSFTIGLTNHDDYDGGQLVIENEQRYKVGFGAGIVYPATSLHEVTPITRGSRLVIVGWARSYIRDAHKRELLFELETAKHSIHDKLGKTQEIDLEIDLLSKCAANLQRMWMED